MSYHSIQSKKKILPVIYENVYRQKKKGGGGLRKKINQETKKKKPKKNPPHSLLETEDLNDLIWG